MGSEKQNKKAVIALCVCGPEGSGKTNLIHRLLYGTFIEAPQTEVTNKPIVILSASLYDAKKGDNQKADIECVEAVNLHLFDHRFNKFSKNYFLNKDAVLIVLDSNNLPDAEKLKTYFAFAKYSKDAIHLIINKLDELETLDKQGNLQKMATSISKLLTEADIIPDYIHYVSSKNSYGIEELRNYLHIPQLSTESKLAENNTLSPTKTAMAKAARAFTLGIIAGGIAGFVGTTLLGILVGVGAAIITTVMLNVANPEELKAESKTNTSKG